MIWLLACARTGYDVVDLQLDVADPLPAAAEQVHVCVAGAGELTEGAGNGRIAFTGLFAGEPAEVRLEVLDAAGDVLAVAGPVTLNAAKTYATAGLADEGEPCADAGERAPDDAETWVLGLRFLEDEPW
ncbi:MAG: hypothetical protein ACOZNI_07435 [Myxococcota bacterium]